MRKVLFLAFASFFCSFAVAQITLQRVHKQYELGVYELAIPGYLEILQEETDNQEAMIHLAHCYRMISEDFEAVKWFGKAAKQGDMEAEDLMAYGHSLKVLGRYQDAKSVYRKVDKDLSYVGSHYFLSCDKAMLMEDDNYGSATTLACNSKTQDFSPEVYNESLYFSSFRKDIPWASQAAKKLANLAESSHHFVIALDDLENGLQPRTPEVSKAFPQHSSPYSIASETGQVVFAKNSYREGTRQIRGQETGVGLYTAVVTDDGSWHEIKAFKHNKSTHSNNYPYITEDGKTLYFSSNRPGGYGGYDIYVSHLEEDSWSEPVNLGPIVNTEGSEITPYFVDDQLYFASDWHFGLGGFDVFVTSRNGEEWVNPTNMGAGFNSSAEDYSPVKLDANHFLLVSNREGSYGMEDIFLFSRKGERRNWGTLSAVAEIGEENREKITSKPIIDFPSKAEVSVNDQSDAEHQSLVLIVQDHEGNRIPNAIVDLDDCGSDRERTDAKGRLLLGVQANCEVTVSATGYLKAVVRLDSDNLSENNTKTVVLISDKEGTVATTSTVKPEVVQQRREAASDNQTSTANHSASTTVSSVFWTVQIAALSKLGQGMSPYQGLRNVGEVHTLKEGGIYKILVGKYPSKAAAQKALETLKNRGYRDAFVTQKQAQSGHAQHQSTKYSTSKASVSSTSTTTDHGILRGQSRYKVRLAAYEDLKWFNVNKVEDLGKVEHWTSGEFAIMVLGGFADEEAAAKALDIVQKRGFVDAKLVYEENGQLKYVN